MLQKALTAQTESKGRASNSAQVSEDDVLKLELSSETLNFNNI